jgi:hypothetical protein
MEPSLPSARAERCWALEAHPSVMDHSLDRSGPTTTDQLAPSTDTDGQQTDGPRQHERDRAPPLRGSISPPSRRGGGDGNRKLFDVSLVKPERGIQVRLRSSGEHRWIPARAGIVQALMPPMLGGRQHLSDGRHIAGKLVSDHTRGVCRSRRQAHMQELFGGCLIALFLDQVGEHNSVLISGSPQPMAFAADLQRHLVQAPHQVFVNSHILQIVPSH